MKKIIFTILILLSIFLISGCKEFIDENNKNTIPITTPEPANTITKQGITLEFSFSECNGEYGPYDKIELGIQDINWLDSTTLEVKSKVNINCGEQIQEGDFEINDDLITLKYKVPDCFQTDSCLRCTCGSDLIYEFSNLEQEEYEFELERIY